MPIVSSLALPHGPMVFDGGEELTATADRIQALPNTLKKDFRAVFRAFREAAEMAKATRPEVIFLNTPHGMSFRNSFAIYLNSRAKGNAEWMGQWKEYDVNVTLDSDLAKAFIEHLQRDNIPANGITAFGTKCEAPLRWGEVVPLWFFRDLTSAGLRVVIFSNSISERPRDQEPLSELIKFGKSIARFLNSLQKRVLYIASGDLSHNHETDCNLSLYLPDPRWALPPSATALTFDLNIEHWVQCTPLDLGDLAQPSKTTEKRSAMWDKTTYRVAEQWLQKPTNMEKYSCGIYGLCILHGILSAEVEGRATYDSHLLCRLAPTYFGMLVAAFIKKDTN